MKFLRIMGGCFVIAGAAAWILAPVVMIMGIIWIVVGVVLIWVAQLFASSEANRLSLLANGKAGQATVLAVTDTGVTINNSPRVQLKVRIEAAGDLPFEATHNMMVSRLHIPRAGEVYEVRFDPKDPNNFAFASHSSNQHPGSSSESAVADTIGQLERLAALRDKGVLTNAEFLEQKRKLLGG